MIQIQANETVKLSPQENCSTSHSCLGHTQEHTHGPGCGHEATTHDDHMDYLVDGHLHHPHGGHCDHHGLVALH